MIHLSYILLSRLAAFESPAKLRSVLSVLRECGYEGVELNITDPLGIDPDELQAMVEDVGLAIPSFLTGEAYADGLCLSSPDASVRRRTVERLISYVPVAARFRAILVVGLLQGQRRDEPDTERANERIIEGLKQVAEKAVRRRSRSRDRAGEPSASRLQPHRGGSAVADPGDRFSRRAADGRHDPPQYRRAVAHSSRSSIAALPCGTSISAKITALFGTGHIDFAAIGRALNQIGYDGFASVKVYRHPDLQTAARESIDYLRRVGFGGR